MADAGRALVRPEPPGWVDATRWVAPGIAALLAVTAVAAGWRGVDVPAQIYRVILFHHAGFTIWDSQWYGGHWTLGYSVVFPPIAGVLGVGVTGVLAAAVAAWAFDRLATDAFGSAGRYAGVVFAAGTLAQVAIGQLPFLLGEAFGLWALLAAQRRRWWAAGVLAALSSLASPLAGAFVGFALAVWLVTDRRADVRPRLALAATPLAVVGALTWLFPGEGAMPFRFLDALLMVLLALGAALAGRHHQLLRNAALLYAALTAACFVVPTAVGANVLRLGQCVGAPILLCVMWRERHRLTGLVLGGLMVGFGIWQWAPTVDAFHHPAHGAATDAAYYQPLVTYLRGHDPEGGRVEVVPTKYHWEAAYVAPNVPLARGWERQLDTRNNPLFYRDGPVNAGEYRAWLLDNGVSYVALPDAPLDYAGKGEAALISQGVPGLIPTWRNANWQVFRVADASGIVDGPAHLVSAHGEQVDVAVTDPGLVTIRVRYSSHWVLSGPAGDCLTKVGDHWTGIEAARPGAVHLELQFRPQRRRACR